MVVTLDYLQSSGLTAIHKTLSVLKQRSSWSYIDQLQNLFIQRIWSKRWSGWKIEKNKWSSFLRGSWKRVSFHKTLHGSKMKKFFVVQIRLKGWKNEISTLTCDMWEVRSLKIKTKIFRRKYTSNFAISSLVSHESTVLNNKFFKSRTHDHGAIECRISLTINWMLLISPEIPECLNEIPSKFVIFLTYHLVQRNP